MFIKIIINADVSRNQRVCRLIYTYSFDLLKVRCNFAKFHHCRACVRDFMEEERRGGGGAFYPSSFASSAEDTHPDKG